MKWIFCPLSQLVARFLTALSSSSSPLNFLSLSLSLFLPLWRFLKIFDVVHIKKVFSLLISGNILLFSFRSFFDMFENDLWKWENVIVLLSNEFCAFVCCCLTCLPVCVCVNFRISNASHSHGTRLSDDHKKRRGGKQYYNNNFGIGVCRCTVNFKRVLIF